MSAARYARRGRNDMVLVLKPPATRRKVGGGGGDSAQEMRPHDHVDEPNLSQIREDLAPGALAHHHRARHAHRAAAG
jgi:hypothetical protein